MSIEVDISPDMQRRVAAIAKWSGRSASQIIADALENGHSLDWQEQFIERIRAGIAAADRGEFAKAGDIERVRQTPPRVMIVSWTSPALANLEEIQDHIASESPAAAHRLVNDILDRTNRLLSQNPRIGRPAGSRGRVNSWSRAPRISWRIASPRRPRSWP